MIEFNEVKMREGNFLPEEPFPNFAQQAGETLRIALMIARAQAWIIDEEARLKMKRGEIRSRAAVREQDGRARRGRIPVMQDLLQGGGGLMREQNIQDLLHAKAA